MTNNPRNSDWIIGYITRVSSENTKKKKYFVKFTLLAEDNHTIDGWIFSSVTGILTTAVGKALNNFMKSKSGIKLWSSLEKKYK